MVGIVIVSHSAKLASGVQELALQMVPGKVVIEIAAGIDDEQNPFGTDAMQVYRAIESADSGDGVVVLVDVGSAVMSAEMALEFLEEEKRAKIRLCEAPLVEGAIAAAVVAAAGGDIEQVLSEARAALAAKASHLSAKVPQNPEARSTESEENTAELKKEIQLTVRNLLGMHARPAAKFASTAARFQANITARNVTRRTEAVNAKSINQVSTLNVRKGDEIAIAAEGADATEAICALQQLVEANFGEGHRLPPPTSEAKSNRAQHHAIGTPHSALSTFHSALSTQHSNKFCGIPASPGIAIGRVILYDSAMPDLGEQLLDDPHAAWAQLQRSLQTARKEIETLRSEAASRVGEGDAAIFDAHCMYLEDPAIVEKVRQLIFGECLSAATAWKMAIDETIATYEALEDAYMQARAADVRDVGARVMRALLGTAPTRLDLKKPGILVAADLTPSYTVGLDKSKVLGICTVAGSATSHSAILARSLGIPAVMGVGTELSSFRNGTIIAIDGETGQVWVNPCETLVKDLQRKREEQLAAREVSQLQAQQLTFTRDRRRVTIMANIFGLADAREAVRAGAEGVGVLRSEFLYVDRATPAREEEQLEIYSAIADTIAPHPLTIRILDVGGDKPLPYLKREPEENPFLGCRGIRLLLERPDLLKTQLRAILRASCDRQIKILLPMIASVREVRAVKETLAATKAQLRQAGINFDEKIQVGIMVEVPAAVAVADLLALEVNFFSIGTNDLSQYVMAADRANPKVAPLADAFEPAVLRLIQQTVKAADSAGIWAGVCGELAAQPLAAPILLGLGVKELSMNPAAIPAVKAAISRLTVPEAEAMAAAVLQLDSAESVREFVRSRWSDRL